MKSLTLWIPRPFRRFAKRIVFFGNRLYCPCCQKSARAFRSVGVIPRSNARCPYCDSLERHRLLWRFLEERTAIFRTNDAQVLHFAAEESFENQFRRQLGRGYLTADYLVPADVKVDIGNIQFPTDTFDVVFCSHVLEHVPDDRLAIREIFRVLKPGGWAIVMVPITVEKTIEDPTVTDPAERLRLFGQEDHVRTYGPDFPDRLREAGFEVSIVEAKDFISNADQTRISVPPDLDAVHHCLKPMTQ